LLRTEARYLSLKISWEPLPDLDTPERKEKLFADTGDRELVDREQSTKPKAYLDYRATPIREKLVERKLDLWSFCGMAESQHRNIDPLLNPISRVARESHETAAVSHAFPPGR
jgi:hypothetical protein